ncbi:sulfocyanin-like copper-binding protein [Streptomyces sp. NPDC001156]
MSADHHRGMWLFIAAAAAALVLGVSTTALLAATGAFRTTAPASWRHGTQGTRCTTPTLAGRVVDVTMDDMGRMMGGPHGPTPVGGRPGRHGMGMMRLVAHPATVPAGKVTLRVVNAGSLTHEVLVLPLPAGRATGERVVVANGRVSETGSLGEASRSCGAGTGDGIIPRATGWTTVTLRPGRYELLCNYPGHYAAGMYTELDVAR